MGHNIQHYDYPENVDRKKVFADLSNYVRHEAWQEGGHLNEIRWLDAKPLPSRDDAEEFLNKHDKGWYDCLAVRYLEADRHNPTRAYIALLDCALPGFVDSKNEEKTERNAGYLVVSHSGGGMLRQGTRKGIRRTPANRGMRAHWVVKGLDISEDVCHGMCP